MRDGKDWGKVMHLLYHHVVNFLTFLFSTLPLNSLLSLLTYKSYYWCPIIVLTALMRIFVLFVLIVDLIVPTSRAITMFKGKTALVTGSTSGTCT